MARSYMATWDAWARALVARFGLPKAFDPDGWRQVIDAELRDFSEAECLTVLAWMQSKGQRWQPPASATDLIKAIRTYRKANRQDTGEPAGMEGCALCHNGLIRLWPDAPAEAVTVADFAPFYSYSGPCRCAAGQRQAQFMAPLTDALWERARRQQAAMAEHYAREEGA